MWWNVSEGITGDENAKVKRKAELYAACCKENPHIAKFWSGRSQQCQNYRGHWKGQNLIFSLKYFWICMWARFEWPGQNPPWRILNLRENHKWKVFISCLWFGCEWKLLQQPLPARFCHWGWNAARNVLELSISLTTVEQTKLPVCAPKAEYSNPNTNFKLVNQFKYLMTAIFLWPSSSAE